VIKIPAIAARQRTKDKAALKTFFCATTPIAAKMVTTAKIQKATFSFVYCPFSISTTPY
jgi:hypothetical protein